VTPDSFPGGTRGGFLGRRLLSRPSEKAVRGFGLAAEARPLFPWVPVPALRQDPSARSRDWRKSKHTAKCYQPPRDSTSASQTKIKLLRVDSNRDPVASQGGFRGPEKGEHRDASCENTVTLGTHSYSNCSDRKCRGTLTSEKTQELNLSRSAGVWRVEFFGAQNGTTAAW
jgi:hypothetical protein